MTESAREKMIAYAINNVADVWAQYGPEEAERVAWSWQRSIGIDAQKALAEAKAHRQH